MLYAHLWQSTLFAALAALAAFALRNNRAAVRHWVWLAASVKFLVPFSVLVAIGGQLGQVTARAVVSPPVFQALSDSAELFGPALQAAPAATKPHAVPLVAWLLGAWLCGCLAVLIPWLRKYMLLRAAVQQATHLSIPSPVPVLASRLDLAPGVFGIWRPVLFVPEGIAHRLPPAQFRAVIAHELCHVRRRDNLAAAIHTVVEALFWFHPLVWWIEDRLAWERELACDQEVVRAGSDPETYAEGILSVCRFHLEPPLAWISGMAGSNLRKRIEVILAAGRTRDLSRPGKLLLAAAGTASLAVPFLTGLVNAPPGHAQTPSAPLSFEVASVKRNTSGSQRAPSMILPGGRFTATNNTVRALIANAYGIRTSYLLSGGPSWIDSEAYDIDAKAEAGAITPGTPDRVLWEKTRLMLQSLLAERFHLAIHREPKEMPIYELSVAGGGPRLQRSRQDCAASAFACHGFSGNPLHLTGTGVDMFDLALILTTYADRPVVDKTQLAGVFDIALQWNPFEGKTPPADDSPRPPAAESRDGPRPAPDSLPGLVPALQQQVGLRLESRKAPVEIYVIDRVERPAGN